MGAQRQPRRERGVIHQSAELQGHRGFHQRRGVFVQGFAHCGLAILPARRSLPGQADIFFRGSGHATTQLRAPRRRRQVSNGGNRYAARDRPGIHIRSEIDYGYRRRAEPNPERACKPGRARIAEIAESSHRDRECVERSGHHPGRGRGDASRPHPHRDRRDRGPRAHGLGRVRVAGHRQADPQDRRGPHGARQRQQIGADSVCRSR